MPSLGPHATGEVLDAAGRRTGSLLAGLGQQSMKVGREVLARHGLKPRQLRILDLLAYDGPVGQRELGETMAIDHSVLVGLLNPLEAKKLVRRERDPDDRRRHVVTITAAGRRRLAKADKAFREAEDEFLAPLDQDQRAELHELLALLRAAGGDTAVADL